MGDRCSNLIPTTAMTQEQRRSFARAGGIASGKARREKRDRINAMKEQIIAEKKAEIALQRESHEEIREMLLAMTIAAKDIKQARRYEYWTTIAGLKTQIERNKELRLSRKG